MTIAPEIQSLLDWARDIGEANGSLPLPAQRERIRRELDAELLRRGAEITPVAAVEDYAVSVTGGEIRVRVFTPHGSGPHPALLHFHGGGFVFGTIDSVFNNAKCSHICRAARLAVVTVEYRLAPEHRFPTAPEDCYAALLWLLQHAGELTIDPARIAVGGESAGGNLATVVALMARDRGGPEPVLQLLEVPVTDLSDGASEHASVLLYGEGFGLDLTDLEFYCEAYLGASGEGSSPYASPLLGADLAGLAPAHILTAEYDMLRDSGEAYARRLAEAGVETTLDRRLGHTHGSSALWQTWDPARAWMDEVVRALESALHPPLPAELGQVASS